MDRNKSPIEGVIDIDRALIAVFEIASTLRLTHAEQEAMARVDTLGCIAGDGGRAERLRNYAAGAIAAHLELTRRLCCEFVYVLAAHEGADDVRVFGLSAHGPHKHYSRMTLKERREALCGYVWLDSDGLAPYTAMKRDSTLDGL